MELCVRLRGVKPAPVEGKYALRWSKYPPGATKPSLAPEEALVFTFALRFEHTLPSCCGGCGCCGGLAPAPWLSSSQDALRSSTAMGSYADTAVAAAAAAMRARLSAATAEPGVVSRSLWSRWPKADSGRACPGVPPGVLLWTPEEPTGDETVVAAAAACELSAPLLLRAWSAAGLGRDPRCAVCHCCNCDGCGACDWRDWVCAWGLPVRSWSSWPSRWLSSDGCCCCRSFAVGPTAADPEPKPEPAPAPEAEPEAVDDEDGK